MIEELHEEMADNNRAQEKAAAEKPHKYREIMDNLIKPKDRPSPEKLLSELQDTEIFDEDKKISYWVDKKGNNCFMLYARALSIIWSGTSYYWRWYAVKETSNVSVDVAELLDVCWLEVTGALETGYLTPETVYEVSFVIMLKDSNYGWEDNVNFSLTLPGKPREPIICKRDLRELTKKKWSSITVGEFKPSEQSGRMEFKLRQLGKWKKGLVIKGVDISPKV